MLFADHRGRATGRSGLSSPQRGLVVVAVMLLRLALDAVLVGFTIETALIVGRCRRDCVLEYELRVGPCHGNDLHRPVIVVIGPARSVPVWATRIRHGHGRFVGL